VRTLRCIIILLLLSSVTVGAGKPVKNPEKKLTPKELNLADSNDISQYYGFGEMEIIKLDWDIRGLQIADFDGDGRNDIAIANNRKAGIDLLIQKAKVGPEEQEVAVDPNDLDINALVGPSRFKRQVIAVSQRIYNLVSGDLNSDGLIDLAFYGEPRGLYVLLQKPAQSADVGPEQKTSPHDLAWQARIRINIDDALPNPNGLVCYDVDNDAKLDLIVASRNAVYIVLQKKDGSLAEPVKYAVAAQVIGVDAGDLNGDKKTDLIIYTDDQERPIHVRLGQKTNQLGPEIRLAAEMPLAAELVNIDDKPGDELVTIDAVSRRLLCYTFGQGDSGLSRANMQAVDDWQVLFYPLPASQASDKRDLVIADIDCDGLSDVIISDPSAAELVVFRQAEGIGLTEPQRFPSLADTDVLSAADIDGDGSSELAVLSVKEKVIGVSRFQAGRLSFPKALAVEGEPLAMELTDIDGDGSADCVYVSRSQQDVRSFRVLYDAAKSETVNVESTDANVSGQSRRYQSRRC
jgi:hypothetical protein